MSETIKKLAKMIKESQKIVFFGGDKLVLINKSETGFDKYANLLIHESIGNVLKNALEI